MWLLPVAVILASGYRSPLSGQPRHARRLQKRTLLFFVPFLGFCIYESMDNRDWSRAGFFAVVLAMNVWVVFRHEQPDEHLRNWTMEPDKCGRCAYDLTGNVSGRCPECGWDVPPSKPSQSDVQWTAWWKKWSIDSLPDWRRKAWSLSIALAVLLSLAIVQVLMDVAIAAIFPVVAAGFVGINLIRVLHYGMSRRLHDGAEADLE